jgi:hypothetical protein
MADVFVIEEATGSDRRRVELREYDLPHGRPRKGAAFELGGPVENNKIWLDGRSDPIIHTHQPRNRPLVIKGHFRDHLWAIEGHARAMMSRLEEMKFRARELTITWENIQLRVFLEETKFGVESINDITYELNFTVIIGASSEQRQRKNEDIEAPVDLVALARARVAQMRAEADAAFLADMILLNLTTAFDAADEAMAAAEQAAQQFEDAGDRVASIPLELVARCDQVKARMDDLRQIVLTTVDDVAIDVINVASLAGWWMLRDDLMVVCTEVDDAMRALQLTARRSLTKAARTYTVKVGDTLESIARDLLGNPARASDIGLQPHDLQPGRTIHLPEAA